MDARVHIMRVSEVLMRMQSEIRSIQLVPIAVVCNRRPENPLREFACTAGICR